MLKLCLSTSALIVACLGTAESTPPRLQLIPVAENVFTSPVAITNAGDSSGRLFIVDQRGTVSIITSDGEVLADPFLDISAKLVSERPGFDERGLLSIAFHPDYTNNGKFYAYYSAPSPNSPGTDAAPIDHQSVVSEFTVSEDANATNPGSERILLTFDEPQFNHDGGQVAFGPDGFLYISTGDGGGADDNDAGHTGGTSDKPDGGLGNSQDLTNLLGKILRVDPLGNFAPGGQYSVPAGNPFAAQDDNARDEIYAYGLRNPWRFSFDRESGQLFCADVGQGEVEEVNLIESGKNYGWRRFEGAFDFDPTAPTTGDEFVAPIGQYAHPNSEIPGLLNIGTSVTGGYVYRGSLIPELVGTYLFGDWTASFSAPSGTLLALEPDGANGFDLSILDINTGNPVKFFVPAFGEDEAGEIYVAGKTTLAPSAGAPFGGGPTGSIYRIAQAPPLAPLPKVRLEPVVQSAIPSPVAITHAGDGSGRLFVVDQRGTVHIITSDGQLLADPFLEISGNLVPERPRFDERGLLSIAFHPDFQNNGKLFAYYSAPSPNSPGTDAEPVDHQSVVSEFTVSEDPNKSEADTERVLLTFDQPQFNHDGGQLAFGPDGFLYISTGDGGGSNDNNAGHTGGTTDKPDGGMGNSQGELTRLLGKILRIDPFGDNAPGGQYGIPDSNPFAAQDDNARDEIYAYGLRNPWRFSFDRENGQLFCADVGQGEIEEINLIESGKNYGWRRFEGNFDFDPTAPTTGDVFEAPIGEYAHPNSSVTGIPNVGTSVTGGYVYRGSESPGLQGAYLFGDWSNNFSNPNGTLMALTPGEEPGAYDLGVLQVEGGNPIGAFLPAFGEDENGEIYIGTKTTLAPSALDPSKGIPTGGIFKIVEIKEGSGAPETVTIEPIADASLFEEGNFANGAGIYLFSGHTADINNGLERRALIKFDIANNVPAGANIVEASVSIRLNKIPRSGATTSNFGLHSILQDWAEGSVNASGNEGTGGTATDGSATWTSTARNTGPDWNTSGGDFNPVASASVSIARARQRYEWTDGALGGDVQGWLDDPASNFGWMLFSDSDADATARRFDSREASSANNRPTLSIDYSSPAQIVSHRDGWLLEFYPNNDFPGDLSDDDNDLLNALLEYGLGTDPTSPDAPGDLFGAQYDPALSDFVVRFVRDPRAIDLSYTVEASTDLQGWTSVASSSSGFPTSGSGLITITESNLLGNHPLKAVSVTLPNITSSESSLHFRLHVTRAEP